VFVPVPAPVAASRVPAPRRGLPLASVPSTRPAGSAVYGMAAMDCRGRIADRAVLQALGWVPSTPIDVRVSGGVGIVTSGTGGGCSITAHGHLRLPATVRHCLGLGAGDRVLLVGRPTQTQLIVYPPAVLDDLLAESEVDPSGEPA
jgi:hypothetical protein